MSFLVGWAELANVRLYGVQNQWAHLGKWENGKGKKKKKWAPTTLTSCFLKYQNNHNLHLAGSFCSILQVNLKKKLLLQVFFPTTIL
jgi:hypothetical protein